MWDIISRGTQSNHSDIWLLQSGSGFKILRSVETLWLRLHLPLKVENERKNHKWDLNHIPDPRFQKRHSWSYLLRLQSWQDKCTFTIQNVMAQRVTPNLIKIETFLNLPKSPGWVMKNIKQEAKRKICWYKVMSVFFIYIWHLQRQNWCRATCSFYVSGPLIFYFLCQKIIWIRGFHDLQIEEITFFYFFEWNKLYCIPMYYWSERSMSGR